MREKILAISNSIVKTESNNYKAKHIINCAGLYADKVAHMMKIALGYEVIPFRGEYMEVKNLALNSMIYQVPNLKYPFLGVHLTKTVNNKVLAGPTVTLSFGRESYNKEINFKESFEMIRSLNFWRMALKREFLKLALENGKISLSKKAFLSEIQKLCSQKISKDDIKPYKSGIRAQMVDNKGRMVKDMLVVFRKDSTHILNAVSPGLTSCLAFAEYVVDNIEPC